MDESPATQLTKGKFTFFNPWWGFVLDARLTPENRNGSAYLHEGHLMVHKLHNLQLNE